MPIDIKLIDKQIAKQIISCNENYFQLDALKFMREKLLNGTEDEKKLINMVSKMTIDNINLLIKTMKDEWSGFPKV